MANEESNESASGETAGTPDTGAACLVILLRFFGLPGEPEQIRRDHARPDAPMTADELARAAKALGLKTRLKASGWDRLAKTPLPAIAELEGGNFVILAQTDGDSVLVQDPLLGRPRAMSRGELEEVWSGRLLLLTRRAMPLGRGGKFDISWFVPAVVRYRKVLGEVVLSSLFVQVFALVSPLFFMVIIDKVLVHRGLTTLDVLIIGLAVISVFEVVIGALRTYTFSHTTNRIDVELGAKLFQHLISLPISYFEARRAGDSVARMRELENIRNFLTGSSLTLVIDLFFTFVFLIVMWQFSSTLTLIVLGLLPFYILLSLIVTPILRARTEEKFQRGAANQAFLVETVTGMETLKAMAVEPEMQRRWEDQLAAYVTSSFRASHLGNISSQTAQLISKATIALTLYVGAKLVIAGDLTVGQLVAFNMLGGRVSGPVLRLASLWQDFQQARISLARLGDILNAPTEARRRSGAGALPPIKGGIEFDDVRFRYRADGPEVLRGVSLTIAPGEVVGVAGPSGSGKSTLAKLVQRLHVPESGRVLVDGVDLAMVDVAWLRRQVGVVLQESVLFNRSIRDNIAFADPSLSMERIVEAAKLAGAHDFILELPEGYDEIVGERGGTLSGGQRQRIAIARALIGDPKILIFDEATSALDYESERAIQDNMRAISTGRTVLIIAHRLSTLRQADRIVTIERGEIA